MKIPIEIQRDKRGEFKAIVSLQDAITHTLLEKDFIRIQKDYEEFIKKSQKTLKEIKKNRKNRGDSMLKWKLADTIYRFAKQLESQGFVFANLTEALSRDLGISVRQVNYLIEFRVTYPDIKLIKKEISWDKYKELLDIPNLSLRKECETKILSGELKTRNDIRAFKKKYKS